MQASQTILQPVFEGAKQFLIPLFQRTYSWKQDDWKTLWEDLLALYTNPKGRKHFMGAIVCMPAEMNPAGVSKYVLIDGQQRITTIFLILAAIRDIASASGILLAEQINESYLINKWAVGTNIFKLFPSQTDREQFAGIIQRKTILDENNNLVKAYRFYKNKIGGKDPSGLPVSLDRLHNILMHELIVVNIVLDQDENPYLIFESLNAKGEPLTQADLVRNYVLMRITSAEEQEVAYKDFWLPMQTSLGDELTQFIWRYLNKDGKDAKAIRLDEIYDEVKQKLSGASSSQTVDLLIDMHTFAEYYRCLIDPGLEHEKDIQQRLMRLNRWDVKTSYPFLLNIYRDFKMTLLSKADFCKILDIIESFVVRRTFCRRPTNALNKIFQGLYKNLDTTQTVNSLTAELLKKDWPGNNAFQEAWLEFPIYSSGNSKCRLILDSLELAMNTNKELVDLGNRQITIEHIMPQTLNEDWEMSLGEQAEDIYESYLHSIGNLTLTGKNSEMGNITFSEKNKVFADSNFALNKDLASLKKWGGETIKARAVALSKVGASIWAHPGGKEKIPEAGENEESVNQNNGPTGKKPTGFVLFGTEFTVETWREMLLSILSELAERHGDEFILKAVNVNTGKREQISTQSTKMHDPYLIPRTSFWVEANQNAKGVIILINKVLVALGDSPEDFEAYW